MARRTDRQGYAWVHRKSVQHGVNDSEYANLIAETQVSRSINFDMTPEGMLSSVGGSIRTAAATLGATTKVRAIKEFRSVAAGVVTRTYLVWAGGALYSYNQTTNVFSSAIVSGLADVRPSIAIFRDNAGVDVVYWTDGTNFRFYDGSTVTNVLTNFQAGAAGATIPRYIWAQHDRLWAFAGTTDHKRVYYSPGFPAHAEQNWGANDYVTLGGAQLGVGLSAIGNLVLVGCEDSIYVVTGVGGTSSDPFIPVRVSAEVGIASHWSIIPHEGLVYFANENGFCVGKLRAALKDSMEIEVISGNVQQAFEDIGDGNWDDIEGVFFEPKQQIYWSVQTTDATNPDRLMVYSVARSTPLLDKPPFGRDLRFVWAGYHSGLSYNAIGVVRNSDGLEVLYAGGADGFVRELYSDYLSDRLSDDTGGSAVVYEIDPREEDWGGPGSNAKVHSVFPHLYMRQNSTMKFEYILSQSQRLPDTAKVITLSGNVPFMHDDDVDVTSLIGSSILLEKPIATVPLRIGRKCKSFQAIFTNVAAVTDEEDFSFAGISYRVRAV